jgi:hypothetical protein
MAEKRRLIQVITVPKVRWCGWELGHIPPLPPFLYLFILKEFRSCIPVSVLNKGVTDGFYGCAHSKGVSFCKK